MQEQQYWPHAPNHVLSEAGGYIVTCGTYRRIPILNTPEKLTLVRSLLFEQAEKFEQSLVKFHEDVSEHTSREGVRMVAEYIANHTRHIGKMLSDLTEEEITIVEGA